MTFRSPYDREFEQKQIIEHEAYQRGVSNILDKIRAEIEKEIIPRNSNQYDHEAMWQNMGLRMALKVIDKYKAESEVQKCR